MAGSVTKVWSHDESIGGRSVTGVYESVMVKEQKRNRGHGNAITRNKSVMGTGFLGHGKVII